MCSSLPVRTLLLIEEIRRPPAIALPIRHLEDDDKEFYFINCTMTEKINNLMRRLLDMQ